MRIVIALAALCASCAMPRIAQTPTKPSQNSGWVDLLPGEELRIQNAYYRTGRYVGTETAQYRVREVRGLDLVSAQPLAVRPPSEIPARDLIPLRERNQRRYRYFYAVVFRKNADTQGSALLGAGSMAELDRLTDLLRTRPESVCGSRSPHRALFPKTSTVALERKP